MSGDQATRKLRGAWYTPAELVDVVVDGLVDDIVRDGQVAGRGGTTLNALDPACGDGRLLTALRRGLGLHGIHVELTGCDVDPAALDAVDDPSIELIAADALAHDWGGRTFDVVVGNPPFVSQMSAATTRGGSSRHGGGPYANTAAEFLALATRLVDPAGGRVAMVLPTSVLGARDAAEVRATVDRVATRWWSWWDPDQDYFDAAVHVCIVGFAVGAPSTETSDTMSDVVSDTTSDMWRRVVTDRLGLPTIDPGELTRAGALRDRAHLNANFRDEYYALVPAVHDDVDGPPLVTSGIIDPGRCRWGERPVRFAKRSFEHPRVDLDRLDARFRAWADRKLVPKVLVASQTAVVEAVADRAGAWLPGIPVTSVVPTRPDTGVDEIEAVLTSPVATILAWQAAAGTGLSTRSVRMSPRTLGDIAWPAGDLADGVAAMRRCDVVGCGRAVAAAYGLGATSIDAVTDWWSARLPAGDARSS